VRASRFIRTTKVLAKCMLGVSLVAVLVRVDVFAQTQSKRHSEIADVVTTASFKPQGRVPALTPGVDRHVRVSIHNPHSVPLELSDLNVNVRSNSPGGCERWVELGDGDSELRVPSRSKVFVTYPIRLDYDVPPDCVSAQFRLAFDGNAVRAD
jgi:hypothetical protein